MRRRFDESSTPPPELLVFDGHPYPTPKEWDEALVVFLSARARWAREHGMDTFEMPEYRIDGAQPWDDEYMLGPVNHATHVVTYYPSGRIWRLSMKDCV